MLVAPMHTIRKPQCVNGKTASQPLMRNLAAVEQSYNVQRNIIAVGVIPILDVSIVGSAVPVVPAKNFCSQQILPISPIFEPPKDQNSLNQGGSILFLRSLLCHARNSLILVRAL